MTKLITHDNHSFLIKPLQEQDISRVAEYLSSLGAESRKRFAPHLFHEEALRNIHKDKKKYLQYILLGEENRKVLGYFILHSGWIAFDENRFSGYGLEQQPGDLELAPSIADNWQGHGLGTAMFKHILEELFHKHKNPRLFLWGGVQASNFKAVRFYEKLGFKILGEFEHHGNNFDMVYKTFN